MSRRPQSVQTDFKTSPGPNPADDLRHEPATKGDISDLETAVKQDISDLETRINDRLDNQSEEMGKCQYLLIEINRKL